MFQRLRSWYNRAYRKNYCPNCEEKITPKEVYRWEVVVIGVLGVPLAIGLYGGIVGILVLLLAVLAFFLDRLYVWDRMCPNCGTPYKDLERRDVEE
ncbi:MAG: hypothetical protein ACLFM9_04560 [Candidatus Aenigmatarchaeota archaeon]